MNIYLLKATCDMSWDETRGFVVIASDEPEARVTASRKCGDEGPEFWKDSRQATCHKIGATDPKRSPKRPRVVLRDFHVG